MKHKQASQSVDEKALFQVFLQEHYEHYDLENDPEEIHNLYSASNQTANPLREEITAKLEEVNMKVK